VGTAANRRLSGLFAPCASRTADDLPFLAADLESGAWAVRHADLLERDSLDLGYRLVHAYAL
jgi:hypothetical protein